MNEELTVRVPLSLKLRPVWLFVALAVVVITGVLSYQQTQDLARTFVEADSARKLLTETEAIISAMMIAESSQRGFLLTGDAHYLDTYRQGVDQVVARLKALEQLSLDNPRRLSQLRALRQLANEKLAELADTIRLYRTQGLPAALAVVDSGREKDLSDRLRDLASRIEAADSDQLQAILRARGVDAKRAGFVIVGGSGFLFVLLLLATVRINQAAARREQLINELVTAREKTAEARDLLATTLSSIGDAVIATDAQGKITFLNPVAQTLTGWPENQAVGTPAQKVFSIVNAETRAPAENPVVRVLRDGSIAGLGNHTILIARNGSETPIDDSAAPIKDRLGHLLGAVLVFRSVSEQRAAEIERERLLRQAEAARAEAEAERQHLHSLFMQAPAIINIQRGPEHVFEFVHPLTTELLGGRDLLGKPMREAVPEMVDQGFLDLLDEVYRTGKTHSGHETPVRLTGPDGAERESYFDFVYKPWHDADGHIAGVMTFAVDVTNQVRTRKQLELAEEQLRQAAKMESLGVLAGGVAHDFNNLLTGVMGNASLALDLLPGQHPARSSIEDVLAASERAADLTRQMLAYSGKGGFVMQPVDLSKEVREIVVLLASSIPRTVHLDLSLSAGLPPVQGDLSQVQQIVMNLVINGAEACADRPGTVTVSTRLQRFEEGGIPEIAVGALKPVDYVCLEVRDTGSGMDEETKAKIFDPFFTTKFTGRGLGLSAVSGIVRGHKGALTIESAPGCGSTFRVYFPASVTQRLTQSAEQERARDGAGTILVIDDEAIVRQVARSALERYGYTVLLAENGQQGVEIYRLQADEINAVLLDLTMPVMTGEETLKVLQQMRPDVAVVLSSGFNEADALRRFGEHHLAGFIQKPYTAAKLVAKMRAALEPEAS
jgi:two-component system, cell cycle sensor histidine kinase and response regulator CckA